MFFLYLNLFWSGVSWESISVSGWLTEFISLFSIVTGSCSESGMAAVWRFSHHHLASQRRHRNDSSREKREEAERRKTQKLNLIRAHQLQLFRDGGSPWQHNVSQMSAEEHCILTELRYWAISFMPSPSVHLSFPVFLSRMALNCKGEHYKGEI